ncbi:MAG: hypothetical protein AAGE84_15455 [Cyanobacteria bacterium P01_G01_bin.39]
MVRFSRATVDNVLVFHIKFKKQTKNKLTKAMENTNWADIAFGIAALLIVASGLFMLFQGIGAMNQKD